MASIWLGFVLLIASSITTEAGRRMKKVKKCEKIAVPECANLGYQRTKFPNPFTNISTQEETNNLTRFLPVLARLNCTKTNAMPFLCSVYVPVCTVRKPIIPPCREFCEKAVGSCPALAESYGIPWPSALVCSNYPRRRSGERCIFKLKPRRKNVSGNKDKKKPKADETKCCRLGEIAANRNKSCKISNTTATTQRRRFLKGLALCKNFEAKFSECCLKRAAKIQASKARKQERKDNKKTARKEKQKKKQEKKANKQKKKEEKQERRKQKKADRKQKKQNKKQNKKNKKGGSRG